VSEFEKQSLGRERSAYLVERADHLDRGRRQADFLVRLAESCGDVVCVRVVPAA